MTIMIVTMSCISVTRTSVLISNCSVIVRIRSPDFSRYSPMLSLTKIVFENISNSYEGGTCVRYSQRSRILWCFCWTGVKGSNQGAEIMLTPEIDISFRQEISSQYFQAFKHRFEPSRCVKESEKKNRFAHYQPWNRSPEWRLLQHTLHLSPESLQSCT